VNCDDGSGELFGNLKADVRVTKQMRKRREADALRILFVARCRRSLRRRRCGLLHPRR
jgi:hypothetical protein